MHHILPLPSKRFLMLFKHHANMHTKTCYLDSTNTAESGLQNAEW